MRSSAALFSALGATESRSISAAESAARSAGADASPADLERWATSREFSGGLERIAQHSSSARAVATRLASERHQVRDRAEDGAIRLHLRIANLQEYALIPDPTGCVTSWTLSRTARVHLETRRAFGGGYSQSPIARIAHIRRTVLITKLMARICGFMCFAGVMPAQKEPSAGQVTRRSRRRV